jgi:uncharacterized protein YndB with AHSA1/START domain
MSALTTTVEIGCPPEEVFAYVTDPTRFAEWQADVVRVDLDGSPGAAGMLFSTVRRIGGVERSMTQEVTEYDPPRRWASRGIAGLIRPSAAIDVEPAAGGGRSRVTFTLDFHGHGLGVPLLPLVRRQAEKLAPASYRAAKENLELSV